MTTAQFAALKPGDRVVCVLYPSTRLHIVKEIVDGIADIGDGFGLDYGPDELDLPDTETPPLFEEDGA